MRRTFALLTLLLSSMLAAQSYKATRLKPPPKGVSSETQISALTIPESSPAPARSPTASVTLASGSQAAPFKI